MKVIILIFFLFSLGGCHQEKNILQGYIEGQYSNISSNLSGKLIKLYVVRGQSVDKGQLLFSLDQEPEQSQLNKAMSNLQSEISKLKDISLGERSTVLLSIMAQRDQAQADLELAESNFNRTDQLYQKKVVSKADYDDALAKLKLNQQKVKQFQQNLAEAELGERQYRIIQQNEIVKAAQASLDEAKWRLKQKTVFAPEAGLIFDTFFNDGEEIEANQPVLSLLAPHNIFLIFFIPEPLLSQIALNQDVVFSCDGCAQQFKGKIYFISAQAEYTPPVIFSRESRYKLVYRVEAYLPLEVAKKVHPGQPVDVFISTKQPVKHFSWRESFWKRWNRK